MKIARMSCGIAREQEDAEGVAQGDPELRLGQHQTYWSKPTKVPELRTRSQSMEGDDRGVGDREEPDDEEEDEERRDVEVRRELQVPAAERVAEGDPLRGPAAAAGRMTHPAVRRMTGARWRSMSRSFLWLPGWVQTWSPRWPGGPATAGESRDSADGVDFGDAGGPTTPACPACRRRHGSGPSACASLILEVVRALERCHRDGLGAVREDLAGRRVVEVLVRRSR